MRELFPRKQIIGLVFSLTLTAAALTVYFFELSFEVGSTVLLVTAFLQAIIQLSVFMHAGEGEDKKTVYTTVYYGIFVALVTIFGTLLTLIWGYY
ncbi:cytochrome aa3 quinol oxidase subunit IV [Paenibacillus barengoltzii]|uniref:Quinol oxidase subunit 4 n=1 Tax=Paenibacillus timonensis TaxID=225915 RepID=A0ABW3S8P8_9BACL|nr:cytochrome aa3 quinol oxidase subunit IV [Paenibacillus timonensis]MCH1638867.1 cytochrome aa3 quinol oxidase subunit IV [Paenibacillus timonensis]